MTDRERMIELIGTVQSIGVKYTHEETASSMGFRGNEELADYLLANGVVVSPYKVGDTVYWYSIYNRLAEAKIVALDGAAKARVENIDFEYELFGDDFGKTVFLTREEAERALKEREQNDR